MDGEFVTFRATVIFESDGAVLTSQSTLRFRSREAVTSSLAEAGFTVDEVRDAPDPGLRPKYFRCSGWDGRNGRRVLAGLPGLPVGLLSSAFDYRQ